MLRPPPGSTLFTYTTLFRSQGGYRADRLLVRPVHPGRRRGTGDLGGLAEQIGRAHGLNSSHLGISYAVFCLKKKKDADYARRILILARVTMHAVSDAHASTR